MNDNHVRLRGNLGKDAEVQRLENGTPVAKFSMVTSKSVKNKDTGEWENINTQWHDVVAWRNLAEKAEKSLKKGTKVIIEGELSHRKYTDKNNIDRYITEVVALSIDIIERDAKKETNFPSEAPPQYQAKETTTTTANVDSSFPDESAEPQANPDGLPF